MFRCLKWRRADSLDVPVWPSAVEVLADDLYAAKVRAAEDLWRAGGINAVPAVEGKYLISGGQLAGVFEEALRGMAGEG